MEPVDTEVEVEVDDEEDVEEKVDWDRGDFVRWQKVEELISITLSSSSPSWCSVGSSSHSRESESLPIA